jgi:CelD/BcsL family acetyltransferase involved in cellulose biosynthesis
VIEPHPPLPKESTATAGPDLRHLDLQRIDAISALDAVRHEWDGFVDEVGSDIYFTVDWLQAWWARYGTDRELECLIVRDGPTVVAALPFCIQRLWAGPVPVRLARFVGADSTLPVFTPAIRAGYEKEVVAVALTRLLDDDRCTAVSLAPLSGESTVAEATEAAAAGPGRELIRTDSTGPHTVFRFPDSFEDYLGSLSKSQRQNHRRYLRKLEKEYDVEYRTISGTDAVAYLDEFVDLHAAQWNDAGKLGHFGDWPDSVEFNRDLITRMADSGRARFYEISGRGRVLAIEFAYVLGDRCFWRLPARDPDPELAKLRLGRLSLAEMFHAVIDDGRRMVEGGPGHYDYKIRLGAEEHALRRVVVSRDSVTARWRTAWLLRWADLLHLLYYRIWFLKLAPALGRSGRPLWRPWIRTRV